MRISEKTHSSVIRIPVDPCCENSSSEISSFCSLGLTILHCTDFLIKLHVCLVG